MFENIREKFVRLTAQTPHYKHNNPQFAAVALLVHVMAVDGHIDPREEQLLHTLVRSTLASSAQETYFLIQQAEKDEKKGFDFDTYILSLKNTLTKPEHILIIQDMMKMMLADQKIRELEVSYILRVSEMLGLNYDETNMIYRQLIDAKRQPNTR